MNKEIQNTKDNIDYKVDWVSKKFAYPERGIVTSHGSEDKPHVICLGFIITGILQIAE